MELTRETQNDDNTGTLDAKDEGILDLLISKQWAIKLATEAARTVLSVDQIIVARQAGGPKPPGPNPVSFQADSMLLDIP
jgi:T-complex protein 1 subunit theta